MMVEDALGKISSVLCDFAQNQWRVIVPRLLSSIAASFFVIVTICRDHP